MDTALAAAEPWTARVSRVPPLPPLPANRTEDVPSGTLPAVSDVDDLVARCTRGDELAFRALFRQHRNDVARLVHRMLGPTADLDDVVQEVWLQVHRSIKDFRRQARFSTWLYRVTVNVVLMHRRAARSRPAFVDAPETYVAKDRDPLPDEQVARIARVRALERLLDRLSEKKRTVFVLHELEGIAPMEIAKIVGAPVLTVRTRLFYARRELAAMMHEEPVLATLVRELEGLGAPTTPPRSQPEAT